MYEAEHEIKLINHILEEAVKHGGDVGGPYRQNQQKLALAINDWLGYSHLNEKYELRDMSRDPEFNGWCELKIVERRWQWRMSRTHYVKSGAGFEENSPLADCNEKFDQSGSYKENGMRPITDTLLVSIDSEDSVDSTVLLIGRKRADQSLEIINAFQGEDASEIYKLLTTVKKGE